MLLELVWERDKKCCDGGKGSRTDLPRDEAFRDSRLRVCYVLRLKCLRVQYWTSSKCQGDGVDDSRHLGQRDQGQTRLGLKLKVVERGLRSHEQSLVLI